MKMFIQFFRFFSRQGLTLCIFFAANPAVATWSIIAVDNRTGETGIAGASCYPGSSVIAGVVPGYGVVTAQGLTYLPGRDLAMKLLAREETASSILKTITSSVVDSEWFYKRWSRQYAVAAVDPNTPDIATYTGIFTAPNRGELKGVNFSVQGNILRKGVLKNAFNRFHEVNKRSKSLAPALLAALVAGGTAGGDRRCSEQQAALSAFLIVAKASDPLSQPSVNLIAPDQMKGGANPINALVVMFKQHQRSELIRSVK